MQDILDNFEFRMGGFRELSRADARGTLIETFLPRPIPICCCGPGQVTPSRLESSTPVSIITAWANPALTELMRRFSEENNEEAGEDVTRRGEAMAKLVFLPIERDQVGHLLLYDGA